MKKLLFILILTTITAAGSTVLLLKQRPRSGETETPLKSKAVTNSIAKKSSTQSLHKHAGYNGKLRARGFVEAPFEIALNEISDMLNGKQPLNFKRAVFLTENAYYDGKLNWKVFCDQIDNIKAKVNQMIIAKDLQKFKTAGNWAIFTYMVDTIPENNFRPYQYDYENFMGDKGYESFMVSNLLDTKQGNCHSLPYLYKILSAEVNVEAFVALAPMHCFIKHKDENGQWWNLELTSGTFSRTSFIMESFNVSDAGMESGLYMKPLSEKEHIALCLNDLLVYYEKKTGLYHGDFVKQAYTIGIKYYPNSLFQLAKRDDLKYKLDKGMEKKGISSYKKIQPYPELTALFKEMEATNSYLRKIGYSSLSPEAYANKVKEIRSIHIEQVKN